MTRLALTLLTAGLMGVTSAGARDLPSLYGYHVGVATTSMSNSLPSGYDPGTKEADGSFFLPTFSMHSMHEDGYWEWYLSPVYGDLVALLTYASDLEEDDLDGAVFSSGIVGQFMKGWYLKHTPFASIGAGFTIGEYGFDSESPDEGYNLTLGPNVRVSMPIGGRALMANLTARYEYTVWHLTPGDRKGQDFDNPNFLVITLGLLPYDILPALAFDAEYWSVLSGNDDLEVDRIQLKVSWRWSRDDTY
ncbi:MAG TPA: hypothetical protein QGF95_05280 [Candidatus Latescibacteria bacterium]|jgi:hypothetical protein|nr:hypothetical protein [Candidatus Latescibacterota bacterium]